MPKARQVGRRVAVYPWIGCGTCAACRAGEENMCSAHHHLGITADGGFASHVLVPHPRYLIDYEPLSAAIAGPLMCSGLTAYGALKHLGERADRGPVLLVGLGGVGMMGLAIARALFRQPPIVADIDAQKRDAALAAGAAAAYDPSDPQARRAIVSSTGGVLAACDFVGSDRSLQFSTGVLARGGKVVVTGLLGGTFSMAAAMFAIKAMTIEGTLTGTLAQAHELIELARAGKIAPIPTHERPFNEAQAALDDLRAGKVVGGRKIAPIPTHERPFSQAQAALDDLRAGKVVAAPCWRTDTAFQRGGPVSDGRIRVRCAGADHRLLFP